VLVRRHFTHHPFSLIFLLMPSAKPGGAKKKSAKAPSLKEVILKEVKAKSSARKATSGKCGTRGNENLPSAMAALTLVGHMQTGMFPLTSASCC
jgi:hypothetical protein